MTVQIATDDHEDLKRMVGVLEAGVAPWPAYSWKPRWPQPWILVVEEEVAAQLVGELYGQQAGLAQVIAVQAGLGAGHFAPEPAAIEAPPAAEPAAPAEVAPVAAPKVAPVAPKKVAPSSKKSGR